MAYKHQLAPGKRTKRTGINNFKKAEWVICPTCRAKFWRTHSARIFCNEKCAGSRPTPQERMIVNAYIATCKRYGLLPKKTFLQLAHCDQKEWYRFTGTERYGHIGKQRKDRFLMILKKFLVDLRRGWYDIERWPAVTQFQKMIDQFHYGRDYMPMLKRRMTPAKPTCPMKYPHCKGAVLPPDCPRAFRDCSMSL